MHKHFADWYNAVSLRHDAQKLDARWKSVEALTSRLSITKVPGLVRVFFSLTGADAFVDEIRTEARGQDQTYLTDGDRNELTVLAGSVVAQAVATRSNIADAVALAVSCVDARGLRQARRLQGVVDQTIAYLANESVRTRMVGKNLVADMDAAALTKLLTAKGGVTIGDPNSVWNATEAVLKELLLQHTKHTTSINLALEKAISRQQEQSDILWWLFSEHTFDGDKAFPDLTVPEACFRGAKDLAQLTRFLPGLFAAPAFLHRMLRVVRKKLPANVKVSEAVDACGTEWKQKWSATLSVQHMADLCPMLFAITKSAEVAGDTGWTVAFERATGLAAHGSLPPIQLALQIYNESLLVRALSPQG